jgi:foldase protein PrsA
MAKDEDLYPTDKDVETEIAFQKKRSSDFVKQLSLAGLTLADIRERIRVDLAREKLVTKNIKVTTADAEKYVKEHPKEFTDPATARCYFILSTTDKKMKDADAELARGQSFNSVAQRMSEAANAKQSQMYPVVAIDSMPGPIKAAVSKKSAGDVTDWIKMPEGWFKLYVNEKTAEKQRVLDDTMIEAVRRSMALSKGSVAREIGRTLLQKFKQAKVKVEYDPLRAPYDDFDKRLKDAQPDDIEKAINGG